MSNHKFKPGPWKIRLYRHHMNSRSYTIRRTHDIVDSSGLIVICKVKTGRYAQGNLDLIKAAPDMYEALEAQCTACQLQDHETDCHNCIVGKAMRKARGETPDEL